MGEFDSSDAVFKAGAEQLLRMVVIDETPYQKWGEEDLPAMLEHQLGAKLDFDLRNLVLRGEPEAKRDQALAEAAAAGIFTFRDLLLQARPPLVLLRFTKDFFKRQAGASDERRPAERVAYLMYLLSIVVAKTKCVTAITKLADSDLLRCVEWGLRQKCVASDVKALLYQAVAHLHAKMPPAG